MLKIENKELESLMTKHIFLLSQEEIKALAFIVDIEVNNFKKSKRKVEFKMVHKNSNVIVECFENSNCSIGKHKKIRNYIRYGMFSWLGCYTFAKTISIFRKHFCFGYDITILSKEKLNIYDKEEWKNNVLLANELIDAE